MPTRTIAYLRVSTDKQADRGVSLDAQRAKAKAYAELYDLDLCEVSRTSSLRKSPRTCGRRLNKLRACSAICKRGQAL
jgi:DNA invertase Pin-like site-specific DNA recombinase